MVLSTVTKTMGWDNDFKSSPTAWAIFGISFGVRSAYAFVNKKKETSKLLSEKYPNIAAFFGNAHFILLALFSSIVTMVSVGMYGALNSLSDNIDHMQTVLVSMRGYSPGSVLRTELKAMFSLQTIDVATPDPKKGTWKDERGKMTEDDFHLGSGGISTVLTLSNISFAVAYALFLAGFADYMFLDNRETYKDVVMSFMVSLGKVYPLILMGMMGRIFNMFIGTIGRTLIASGAQNMITEDALPLDLGDYLSDYLLKDGGTDEGVKEKAWTDLVKRIDESKVTIATLLRRVAIVVIVAAILTMVFAWNIDLGVKLSDNIRDTANDTLLKYIIPGIAVSVVVVWMSLAIR